jgi:pentatricopeptide repeat protein
MGAGRQERGEILGVLETVQIHLRSKHAFASSSLEADSNTNESVHAPPPLYTHSTSTSRPVIVRRNSTSAPISSEALDSTSLLLPLPQTPPPLTQSLLETAPLQSIIPPPYPDEAMEGQQETPALRALKSAMDSKDSKRVMREVFHFRATAPNPHVTEFNMALEALHWTRQPGEPLTVILETYSDMLQRSIIPNIRTYLLLIQTLIDREVETQRSIASLESRTKRRTRSDAVQQAMDEQRIVELRAENNLVSAMSLFDAAIALNGNPRMPFSIYSTLIKCCSMRANIEGAIHVFAYLERRSDILPNAAIFKDLMTAYIRLGDIQGVEEVFAEFRSASQSNRIGWDFKDVYANDATHGDASLGRTLACNARLDVWNKMLEAYFCLGKPEHATDILGQMMDHGTIRGVDFNPASVPAPSSSTYTTIITGFCQSGDVKTALTWFDQLLAQGVEASRHSVESRLVPSKPDQDAWAVMLESLANEGMVDDLNRVFTVLKRIARAEGLLIRPVDRLTLFAANIKHLENRPTWYVLQVLDFLEQYALPQDEASDSTPAVTPSSMRMLENLADQYIRHGASQKALELVEREVNAAIASIRLKESIGELTHDLVHERITHMRQLVASVCRNVLQSQMATGVLSLYNAMRIARLSDSVYLSPRRAVANYYLHAYALAKASGTRPDLTPHDWQLLLFASTSMELPQGPNETSEVPNIPDFAFRGGTKSLLIDMHQDSVPLRQIGLAVIKRIYQSLVSRCHVDELQVLYKELGPDYEDVLNIAERSAQGVRQSAEGREACTASSISSAENSPRIRVDAAHSRFVDEHFPHNSIVSPLVAFARFQAGEAKQVYPIPVTLARLITSFGRMGDLDKIRTLYDAAQLVLKSIDEKPWQTRGWFQIEDSMICAFAHAGDVDSAHVHRVRILEQGGVPSADSYGALIHSVKDTTDDTSNAMALFQESQARGVTPTIYLYNTIISKLAKARKADLALELFQQMKANGSRPSSVTFGAVIAACARVGDTHSAELLFTEMTSQRNFRPRIPPYNTMMQMYISTKPDREKALYYFDALLKANIEPSAHTYKVSKIIVSVSTVEYDL